MFLRKSRLEPLPVTMSAVRMGERVLQIGVDDPTVTSAIAAKVGLSGNAAIAVTDDRESARAHGAAANAGVLVDVKVTPLAPLPFDNDAFDLVIVHGMRGLLSSLHIVMQRKLYRLFKRCKSRESNQMCLCGMHSLACMDNKGF